MRSEVVSFLTGEREAKFVASSSDSEVSNELLEEFDIGVAGVEAVKKLEFGLHSLREVRERAR